MALGTSRSASMSSGLLLDPLPSPTAEPSANNTTRFRPYASPDHHVTKARYITSNDPRGYIPVYEYPLNGQWIMLDMDDGYILWTGIWKALGNSKADIVKIIDSQPDLAAQLRRVRGGYLKIQGTWMPYEIALRLARRVAWPIRYDLVPLFGPNFPETCLSPDSPGYGQIAKPGTGKRRARRNPPSEMPLDSRHDWTVFSSSGDSGPPNVGPPSAAARSTLVMSHTFAAQTAAAGGGRHLDAIGGIQGSNVNGQGDSPVMLHVPYVERPHVSPTSSTSSGLAHGQGKGKGQGGAAVRRHSPSLDTAALRYSPYPSPLSSTTSRFSTTSSQGAGSAVVDISPTSTRPPAAARGHPPSSIIGETIKLPPIVQPPSRRSSGDGGGFQLPPISSMDNLREAQCGEPMAVLRRLQSTDDDDDNNNSNYNYEPRARRVASADQLGVVHRRHSVADHLHKTSDPSLSSARETGSRTPLSATAALPPARSSFLLPRHEHQPSQPLRSPIDPPPSSFSFIDPTRRAPPPHDDHRLARSVPPSPCLGASQPPPSSDYHRPRPPAATAAAFFRQDRPPSPPPSASSPSAASSPSDSATSGWRPW